jgi:hypothetical protein
VLIQSITSLTLARCLEVLRIGRRVDLVGKIFQDGRTFGELEIAVLEQWHQTIRVDGRVGRLHVRAGHQVDEFLVHGDIVIGREQPHRPAGHGNRMHVELHFRFSPWMSAFAIVQVFKRGSSLSAAPRSIDSMSAALKP